MRWDQVRLDKNFFMVVVIITQLNWFELDCAKSCKVKVKKEVIDRQSAGQ